MTRLLRNRTLLCMTVLLGSLASAQAADWTQFRGPGGLATADDKDLPTTWDATTNVAWKTPLSGRGASSPIVVGDRVFLTCYTGYAVEKKAPGNPGDLLMHLVCLKRADGSMLWDKTFKSGAALPPIIFQIELHGFASATPVADADTVYTLFSDGEVTAWGLDGTQKWTKNLKFRIHPWGAGASPVLAGDCVIVTESMGDGAIVALARKDGSEVWRQAPLSSVWDTPLVLKIGGHDELIVSVHSFIQAFDPAKGTPLWKAKGIADYIVSSPVAADGVVYAIGGRKGEAVAVRAGGQGDVTASNTLWRVDQGSNVSSPVYYDGHLYWAQEDGKQVYCVDTKTGQLTYKSPLPPPNVWLYASPIVGGGNLYYLTRDGTTYVVAAKPEFQIVATNKLGGEGDAGLFNASPVPSQGQLLIRSDKFLYCIGKK